VIKGFTLFIILFLALPYYNSASPLLPDAKINVTIDYLAAEEFIRLIGLKSINDVELSKFAGLYSNKLLIEKVSSSTGGTEQVFKETLKEIITKGKIVGLDPYQWGKVKRELPNIKKLIADLKLNKVAFISEIKDRIVAYTPTELPEQQLKACLVLGGTATGFVIGEDPSFCIALQNFGTDLEGLKTIMVHELYHTIQQAGQSLRKIDLTEKSSYNTKATYYLFHSLWTEGTAEKLGDFSLIKNALSYSKGQQETKKKNDERLLVNFRLIEMMIFKMYTDTNARYQAIYSIGFSPVYEEAGYSVGAEMTRKLEQFQGKKVLADIVIQDPLDFATSYIKLYHEHPKEVPYHFDKSTEAIVDKLIVWRNKI
jgi:hypothetical protein